MDHDQYLVGIRNEIVSLAREMVNSGTDLIVGCRKIVSLSHEIDEHERDLFLPLIGFVSETDIYPQGEVRDHFEKGYLEELDRGEQAYVLACKESLTEDLKKIIEECS